MYPAYIGVYVHESVYENTTLQWIEKKAWWHGTYIHVWRSKDNVHIEPTSLGDCQFLCNHQTKNLVYFVIRKTVFSFNNSSHFVNASNEPNSDNFQIYLISIESDVKMF